MRTYQEIVAEYKKRQRDTVVDSIATGLTYMDNLCIESGILEETGLMTELSETACGALPFVLIACTEGSKVILGRKPAVTGLKDGAYRAVKSTAALGVGAAVASATGLWAALPVTMGVRAMFDRYHSKALTGMRVESRTKRLHELSSMIGKVPAEEPALPEAMPEVVAETEAVIAEA